MRPGFAGLENDLLYSPKTMLVFGHAKDTLTKVFATVKNGYVALSLSFDAVAVTLRGGPVLVG